MAKKAMVRYMQHVAARLGVNSGVSGHACRVSGARRMARAGVDIWHIQLFARWESKVILRYVKEAPLAASHLLAGKMVKQQEEVGARQEPAGSSHDDKGAPTGSELGARPGQAGRSRVRVEHEGAG